MQNHRIFQSAALVLFLSGLAGSGMALEEKKTDYQVGDRLPQHSTAAKSSFKEIIWDDLMPKDWDPMTEFKKLDFTKMKDSDPRAQEALLHLRETWNNSPVVSSMNGVRIRIPGFIVPLEVAPSPDIGIPAGSLFRRMHPCPAAARQPDHPCVPGEAVEEGVAKHGCRLDQRCSGNTSFRYRHG
ncbi:MAG: DUF3299 domain-containing protein [Nitrosomonadales bacterium]